MIHCQSEYSHDLTQFQLLRWEVKKTENIFFLSLCSFSVCVYLETFTYTSHKMNIPNFQQSLDELDGKIRSHPNFSSIEAEYNRMVKENDHICQRAGLVTNAHFFWTALYPEEALERIRNHWKE